MRFKEMYQQGRPVYSLEFFPPRDRGQLTETFATIDRLAALRPDYMTVTYGAGGGAQHLSLEVARHIINLKFHAIAHLTCRDNTVSDIDRQVDQFLSLGVRNILALRGDPPKGQKVFTPARGGFGCARDLVSHLALRPELSIAVAGYPETHREALSPQVDIEYLREKIEAGAEVVITQLFFDAGIYHSFVQRVRAAGISAAIIPGIMPVSNVAQVKRFTSMCGASIPREMARSLVEIEGNEEKVIEYGITQSLALCRDLLSAGAPGIHFYTLNKSQQVERILTELQQIKA